MKPKKRMKKEKTTLGETPFEPLVPETRIIISVLEDAMLFLSQSTEGKFCLDLDRDLVDVKADIKCMVPAVSEYYITIEDT